MTLKNSFHTQLAIGILLNDEPDLVSQLGLLTEISLASRNDETFKICEGFRERLCGQQKEEVRANDIHLVKTRRLTSGNSRDAKFTKMDGDK